MLPLQCKIDRERIIEEVIFIEGGYNDDPLDSGGKTKYGITENVARSHGYSGKIKDLPKSLAFTIYETDFWQTLRLDDILQKSTQLSRELFDTAVNLGVYFSGKSLQRCLNVLNLNTKLYTDLKVDGIVGGVTISALMAYLSYRKEEGVTVLLRMLNSLQGSSYVEIAERREKDEKWIYGWFKNRVVM